MSMIPSDDAFDADSLRALGGTVPSAKSTSVGKVGKFGARSWLEAQDTGMSLIPGMGRTRAGVKQRRLHSPGLWPMRALESWSRIGGKSVPVPPAVGCTTHVPARAAALVAELR